MDIQIMQLMRNLPEGKQATFAAMYASTEKSGTTAVLLCLFLGGVGAHHYYLGRVGIGVLSTLFFWTFIPCIVAFFELFFLSGVVRKMNTQVAYDIYKGLGGA